MNNQNLKRISDALLELIDQSMILFRYVRQLQEQESEPKVVSKAIVMQKENSSWNRGKKWTPEQRAKYMQTVNKKKMENAARVSTSTNSE